MFVIKYNNKPPLEIMCATMPEAIKHPSMDSTVTDVEEIDLITGEYMGGIHKTPEGMWSADIMVPEEYEE
jgi:hypothetical protein